jgi:hypothetical protein
MAFTQKSSTLLLTRLLLHIFLISLVDLCLYYYYCPGLYAYACAFISLPVIVLFILGLEIECTGVIPFCYFRPLSLWPLHKAVVGCAKFVW